MKTPCYGIKFSILFLLLLCFFSIKAQKNKKKEVKSICLLQVMIGKPQINIYYDDTITVDSNKVHLVNFLIKEQSQNINKYRLYLANQLKQQLKCNIVYGAEMINDSNYINLGLK
jgi:hypothetical protein